ncbi:type IV secretion system DNA-binding domain-containing protein [Acetobacteraceae bacterium]|nr:type IV secretion system DNA-binding domain-containing protein [Candidatus Parcubacteria bacterium]
MQEDPNKITFFAATNSRGKEISFGIKRRDRARHMYVIGKTGMGKSTLLENMAIQDVRNGEGMAFIDPHGSTAERILEYVPENRIKDVLYFAPFDMDYPVAFNVMEDVGYDKRHLVVSGLLSAFRKIWVDAWSARMEYILSNTLLALLEYPGATLLDVNRMLVNKAFRKKVVENVKDPVVRAFWLEEFATYTDRYTQEATPAIQNKIGQFTSNPLIRNIVGQSKSSFDIRQMMDEKKILIINLSKGRVGEVNATLLGSMLVTKIYLAAMSRADVSATTLESLPSFYFYVDEFQSFANQSFADILSEARKYKLNLIIAHQYIEQMEEEVRDAVFGNVGTTVTFRVGPFDAEVLETIFNPQFTAQDLVNLGAFQIYLTLMIDGVGSPPFSATSLPPFDKTPQMFVSEVMASSRTQFGKQRVEVEGAIEQWHEIEKNEAAAAKPKVEERRPTFISSSTSSRPSPSPRPAAPAARAYERPPERTSAPAPRRENRERKPEFAESRAPKPRTPEVEQPPLEGAKSLREALVQATGMHMEQVPLKDLKETLGAIAPTAAAKTPSSEPKPTIQSASTEATRPAGLPEDVLRSMLAVDETGEQTTNQ